MTTENTRLKKETADANAALEHAERRLARELLAETTAKLAAAQAATQRLVNEHRDEVRRANDGKIIAENNLRIEKDNNAALAAKCAAVEAQRNRLQVFTDKMRETLNAKYKTLRAENAACRQVVASYVPNGFVGIETTSPFGSIAKTPRERDPNVHPGRW